MSQPESLLELVRGTRQDVAAMRRELTETNRQFATISAEVVAARRELDDHEQRLRALGTWRATIAGGIAFVTVLLVPLLIVVAQQQIM